MVPRFSISQRCINAKQVQEHLYHHSTVLGKPSLPIYQTKKKNPVKGKTESPLKSIAISSVGLYTECQAKQRPLGQSIDCTPLLPSGEALHFVIHDSLVQKSRCSFDTRLAVTNGLTPQRVVSCTRPAIRGLHLPKKIRAASSSLLIYQL